MRLRLALFAFLFCGLAFGQTPTSRDSLPKLSGAVNDFENVFLVGERLILSETIKSYERESTNEIAIVTTGKIGSYDDIFDYSLALANASGIGKKGKDNGVLIVVSKSLRKVIIQVGTGLEEKLTNNECKSIIQNKIVPNFKTGDYFKGIDAALTDIKLELQ